MGSKEEVREKLKKMSIEKVRKKEMSKEVKYPEFHICHNDVLASPFSFQFH